MPLIACSKALKECLPCDDDPLRNLSAEDPDTDVNIGIYNFILRDVPLNNKFRQSACKKVCESTVSQEEADDCARRAAQECVYGDVIPPPDDFVPFPIPLFYNTAQSFTTSCPDGTEFTWTIRAGEFVALNQNTANSIARSVAKNRAIQHRICILTSRTGVCLGSSSSFTIQAVGGTALFFPYIHGPQTPFGFFGCGSNFQPVHYIWTIISGSLPPGIELDECTGILSGTPTSGGTYTVTIRATDAIGSYQQKSITICSIQMGPETLPNATPGQSYLQNLTETPGDQESESWALISGSLPDGLSLSSTGIISGTPTIESAAKGFIFRVRVTVGSC